MKKLQDKVALITGGGQGLGKSIALAMAREGANIVICDINEDTMVDAVQEIEAEGVKALGVRCDVSSSVSVESMFTQAKEHFGTVHILVNNAAINPTTPAEEERRNRLYAAQKNGRGGKTLGFVSSVTDQEWNRYWGVNVSGVFYCTRAALKLMEPQGYGKIINIASISGLSAESAFSPAYSVSKAAVISFTKTSAVDVAGGGIYVNCIACGGVMTPPLRKYLAESDEEKRANLFSKIPLGRVGEPEEYASLAVYLASDGHYLVGQIISPNGGLVV